MNQAQDLTMARVRVVVIIIVRCLVCEAGVSERQRVPVIAMLDEHDLWLEFGLGLGRVSGLG